MSCLIVDPKILSFCTCYHNDYFIGHEKKVNIVEDYNRRSLHPMFFNVIIIYTQWKNLKLDV
jgi:hypothetical protein